MEHLRFNSYEEISSNYPLDGIHNFYYIVDEHKFNCITEADLQILKEKYPGGYFDKDNYKYICHLINKQPFYDHYCFNGEYWYLGLDSLDGVYEAELPKYGKQFKSLLSVFKTLEEAEDYKKYLDSGEYLLEF